MGFHGIVSDCMGFMELFVVTNFFLEAEYRLLFLIIFGSMGHCYFIGTYRVTTPPKEGCRLL
jgi:hypothetical protein